MLRSRDFTVESILILIQARISFGRNMNDFQIRKAFHQTHLRKHHYSATTRVVDELGIEHGRCRADIAVINGHMIGYEIKSDVDTLKRLNSQICAYNAIFDKISIIIANRHLDYVSRIVPDWWGIILAQETIIEGVSFEYLRHPITNTGTNDYSIAQLLWRNEAQEILINLGIRGAQLKKSRALLYRDIINILPPSELRHTVREYLKKRQGWRDLASPFLNDGLSQLHEIGIGSQV